MRRIQQLSAVLLALFVLALVGCAASETTRSTGTYIDDKAIATKVKTQLAADSITSAMQIEVEVYNGVVQLSGFVDNAATIERAEEIARGVAGVRDVNNNISLR